MQWCLFSSLFYPLYPLKELSGHGEGVGVSVLLLVCAVDGLHHRGHKDLCFWTGLSDLLLLFPVVWNKAVGQTIQSTPHAMGLSHHLQRSSYYIKERAFCEYKTWFARALFSDLFNQSLIL